MKKKFIAILLCGVLFTGCGNVATVDIPELLTPVGKSVSEATLERKDLYTTTVVNGEVIGDTTEYSFPSGGRISVIYKKLGDRVYKGELIADMDSSSAQGNVSAINDDIRELKSAFEYKLKELEEANRDPQISWQDKEMNDLKIRQYKERNEATMERLNAELEEAKEKLAGTSIYAEADGDVTAVSGRSGGWIQGNTPFIAVVNSDKKYIVCSYIEDELLDDAKVCYTLCNGKQIPLTKVDSYPVEEPLYTRFTVPDESLFYIGDYAPIIVISDFIEKALTVPKDAVYNDDNGDYVYLTTDGNRTKKYVTLGFEGINDYEVLEGLGEKDRVYMKDDSTTSSKKTVTKRGNFVITTKAKASSNYSTQTSISVEKLFGTQIFEGFNFQTYEKIEKGQVIGSYHEIVDEDYVAETKFSLSLALMQKEYEKIAELENTLEDIEEAVHRKDIIAPYDGIMTSTERIYKGSTINNGRICNFASTDNLLLSADNSGNAFRYGQTVTVEAIIDGKNIYGTGRVLSASRVGLIGNYNTSTAYIRVDDEWQHLAFGANRMLYVDNVVVEDVVLIPVTGVMTYNGNLTVLSEEDGKLKRSRFVNGRKGSDYYWAVDGVDADLTIYFE